MMKRQNKSQTGSILVMALGIMALTAGIATSLLMRQSIEVKKTELMLIQDKLQAAALYAQAWGLGQLEASFVEKGKEQEQYDDLTQPWAQPLEPLLVDGVTVAGRIIDLQGFFNVNTLLEIKNDKPEAPPDKQKPPQNDEHTPAAIFTRIVENLPGYAAAKWQPPQLTAKFISDWISEAPQMTDDEYALGNSGYPYRPAKRPLLSISELRLINGIVATMMQELLPAVSALPVMGTALEDENQQDFGEKQPEQRRESSAPAKSEDEVTLTKININTASPLVLSAVMNVAPEKALEIVAQRPFQNKKTLQEIIANLPEQGQAASMTKWLDIKSDYFMIESKASFRDYEATWYTVVYRSPEKKVEILYKMRGVY